MIPGIELGLPLVKQAFLAGLTISAAIIGFFTPIIIGIVAVEILETRIKNEKGDEQ